jgi:hypothetical protein
MQVIQDACVGRDAARLASAAHYLKSMVGNMAAMDAFATVARLETVSRQGDLTQAAELVSELQEKTGRLETALAGLRAEVCA